MACFFPFPGRPDRPDLEAVFWRTAGDEGPAELNFTFPIHSKLKDDSPVQLTLADHRDIEPLRRLYQVIVEEGTSYPHDRLPDHDDFMDYWFRGKQTVLAYVSDRERAAGMAGAFCLKPHWVGLAANAPLRHL